MVYHRKRRYPKKTRTRKSTGVNSAYKSTADISAASPIKGIIYRSLPYTFLEDQNSGFTTASKQTFRLNSLYDPDFTGVGAQPYGRDTLADLYYRYCVTGVTVQATIVNNSDCCSLMYCMVPTDTLANNIDHADLASEHPGAIFQLIPPQGVRKVRMDIDFNKLLKKDVKDDDDWMAAFGDNPANPYYLFTFTQATDKTTAVHYTTKYNIVYRTKISESKSLEQS